MKYLLTLYFYDSEGFEVSFQEELEASCNTEASNLANEAAKKVNAVYYNVEKVC